MDKHSLPTNVEIDGVICTFDADYRNVLYMFEALTDPDLLEEERIIAALNLFYDDDSYQVNIKVAIEEMFEFIRACEPENERSARQKPLYDWEQDFNIIVAPVNKVLGFDCRGTEFLHWWTFLSAFLEIGECTFSTFVAIRDKKNTGKRLEKHEEKIYRDNRDRILLKKKVDSTTQSLMDEILGKGV